VPRCWEHAICKANREHSHKYADYKHLSLPFDKSSSRETRNMHIGKFIAFHLPRLASSWIYNGPRIWQRDTFHCRWFGDETCLCLFLSFPNVLSCPIVALESAKTTGFRGPLETLCSHVSPLTRESLPLIEGTRRRDGYRHAHAHITIFRCYKTSRFSPERPLFWITRGKRRNVSAEDKSRSWRSPS